MYISLNIVPAIKAIEGATTLPELEQMRIKYLGRNSSLLTMLKRLDLVPLDQRIAYGAEINRINAMYKAAITKRYKLIANRS